MDLQIDLGLAFTYMTKDEEFFKKLLILSLWTFLCIFLVPIPAVLGYFVVVTRNVQQKKYELPEFDFGTMFKEGLYPLLVMVGLSVLLGFIIFPVNLILNYMGTFGEILRWGVSFLQFFFSTFVTMAVIAIYAKSGDVNSLVNLENYKYLLEKNTIDIIVAAVILTVLSMVLIPLGLAAFCIGVFFTSVYYSFVYAGMAGQLDAAKVK